MKRFFLSALTLLAAAASFGQSPEPAPTAPAAPSMRAELVRSTSGRTLNDRNLADGTMPLKKGMMYDVVEQRMGYVVISANSRKVVVAQTDVTLSPKPVASTKISPSSNSGFTPGEIVLISAKYTLEGNQPRNVKNRLSKLVPTGVITEPVRIMVSDDLSSAATLESGRVTVRRSGSNTVFFRGASTNILTVEYSFNGEIRKKQAIEGSYLTLP